MKNDLIPPQENATLSPTLGISLGKLTSRPALDPAQGMVWTLPVVVSVEPTHDSALFWQAKPSGVFDWHTAHITVADARKRVLEFDLPGSYDIRVTLSGPRGVTFSPTLSIHIQE